MNKAVAYMRVSGLGQAEGQGFHRQDETIREWAAENDYELVHCYQEVWTGCDAERPVFSEMIDDLLSNGARTIVIESMDRLARDVTVSQQLIAFLIRKEIRLISAITGQDVTADFKKDPMLKAMIQIQSVFAELEKNLLVRRLKKARSSLRKQNGSCEGRKPFGTRPGENHALYRIEKLNSQGLSSYKISNQLNAEGFPTRTGKPWAGPTVKGILERL